MVATVGAGSPRECVSGPRVAPGRMGRREHAVPRPRWPVRVRAAATPETAGPSDRRARGRQGRRRRPRRRAGARGPPRSAAPSSSRRSRSPSSCPSVLVATRSPRPSATTRSSSSRARPAPARRRRSRRSPSTLGRGREGQIGHTQPRRIAARSVAERINEEIAGDAPLGGIVGYQVRFTDESSESTLVKVMTDGILLAQIQRDPMLRAYDTLIIDEAHERSLNIDFILGYLTRLLPQRPDLKVVITSATIDSDRFATPLRTPTASLPPSSRSPGARTPSRSGTGRSRRSWSRAQRKKEDRDPMTAIAEAVDELMRRGPRRHPRVPVGRAGDPRRRGRAARLARPSRTRGSRTPSSSCPSTAACPPPSSTACSSGTRTGRVVLSTNVAETSLTVPGIRYVIDPGTARISPVLQGDEGAAAAHRADLAGVGEPALRTLRARRRRHRDPAVLAGGLRVAARVHRARDPAHVARVGDPADDRGRRRGHAGGDRRLPVRRPARHPRGARRRAAADRAGRARTARA